jgi:lysozyme
MDLAKLQTKQDIWEGVRTVVYDDATGNPIGPSSYVKGNPSVGRGRNLRKPMSQAAIDYLWDEDANEAFAAASMYPWFAGLNEARQLAVVDQIFSMGAETFATFTDYIGYLAAGNFAAAASDLRNTAWYGQVGQRAVYDANAIETGTWP